MAEEIKKGIYEVRWIGCRLPFNLPYPWSHAHHDDEGTHCVAIVPAHDQHEAWNIVKLGYGVPNPDVYLEHITRQSPDFQIDDLPYKVWAPSCETVAGICEIKSGIQNVA